MQFKNSLVFASALNSAVRAVPSTMANRQAASNYNTSTPAFEPYLELSLVFTPPTFATDFFGRVGLANQAEEGSFAGKIKGTIPAVGQLELDYPVVEPSTRAVRHARFICIWLLNID